MSEILDEGLGINIPDYIVARTGALFSSAGVYGGYIIMAASLMFFITENIGPGIFCIIVGGFLGLSHTGVKLDTANKKLKQFTSFYGIRFGKFEDVDLYPFICVMKSNKRATYYSTGSGLTVSSGYTETSFDIYLLDKTHRNKIQLQTCPDKATAVNKAKSLATKLGTEYTFYNPPISEKTKSRRR